MLQSTMNESVTIINHRQLEETLAMPSTILLDVRERSEFFDYNIGGLNVPPHEINDYIEQLSNYENVVITCSNGLRSGIVLRLLLKKLPNASFFHLEEGV
jgi:rhodanese-related sulfurtransferase